MAKSRITRSFELTPTLDRYVKEKVDSGHYQSPSEVVREGLRMMEQRDRALAHLFDTQREQIELGWQQSERGETVNGPAVFAAIRRLSKARRAAAEAGTRGTAKSRR